MTASDALKIGLGCFIGTFMLFFFVRRLCVNTESRNFATYTALQSPSVRNAANAFDRRVALATREAAKGFVVCAGCGFDNPMERPRCVLCGVTLQSKRSRMVWSRNHPAQQDGGRVEESARQRQIRRRREWTRQVSTSGSVVWRQDETCQRSKTAVTPSYVVDFTAESIEVVVHDVPDTSRTPLAHAARTREGELPKPISTAVTTGTEVPMSGLADSLRVAELDFPSKLAHFINSMAVLFRETTQEGNANEAPIVRFQIVRESLLSDSVQAIASLTPAESRGAIRVEFAGEQGIDAGGVYREWVQLMNQAIVTPEAGIFTCVNAEDRAFYLNSQARQILGDDYQSHFLVAGRLVGRALLEGNATGFHLSLPLLKIIVGLPVGFDDLEYYDPDVYKSLKWLVEHDGVDALCLDFTAVEKLPDGKSRTVELVPGGSEIEVTDANKLEYIDRKLRYLLFESVASQLSAFLQGLYEVVPVDLLTIFDAEELGFVLCGSDEIDVDDWETHTMSYSDPNEGRHREFNITLLLCYHNFWKAVRELSLDERRRLLQFTTGSTRPPPGGFGSLTSYDGRLSLFTLRAVPTNATRGYLRSHACFNRLDLPTHSGYAAMREAVLAAIAGDTNGFTID